MANRLRGFTLSEPIFTDANIFVYQQGAHPTFGPECRDFLDHVEPGQVQAVTSSVVINESIDVHYSGQREFPVAKEWYPRLDSKNLIYPRAECSCTASYPRRAGASAQSMAG